VSIQSLLRSLAVAGVEFVVVGGVAGAVQGSPFVTNDLDICYASDRANLTRIARLLIRLSAYPRGWERGLPFMMDPRTLRTTPVMTLQTTEGELDLLDVVNGVGNYGEAVRSSEEVNAFGIRFRVLTLDGLIRARRASARPKDLAQLPTLEALADMKQRES
jgi:predicted nucleotidyltransferase